jgi:hypothetical protein
MALWDTFWRWLRSPQRPARGAGAPGLQPLDVDRLAAELDLAVEARRLGLAGLPSADATALSGPEAQVLQRIEQARHAAVEQAARRLSVIDADLARQDRFARLRRTAEADREFERAALALVAEREPLLRTLRDAARARRSELQRFAARHGLQRDPEDPSPSARLLLAGLLVLMVVLEGVANAFFFAQGLSTGLVGGFVEAALFAALNVGIAYLLGRHAVRQLAHAHPLRKLLGLLGLAAAVAAMTAIGLGIAHLRDEMAAGGGPRAADAALGALRAAPLALAAVSSWALFGLSLLFALGALADGWKSDDPYPGYGRVGRRARLALDDHAAELDELREALAALREAHVARLDDDVAHVRAALVVADGLLADKRATATRMQHALEEAARVLQALLQRFRTDNELARAGAPRPPRFDSLPPLAPLDLPEIDLRADEAALARDRQALAQLEARMPALRSNIQAAGERLLARLALEEADDGLPAPPWEAATPARAGRTTAGAG